MRTVAYNIGYAHGIRNQPASRIFMDDTSFEAQQYKQGYTDGGVALQDDIEREKNIRKTKHAE